MGQFQNGCIIVQKCREFTKQQRPNGMRLMSLNLMELFLGYIAFRTFSSIFGIRFLRVIGTMSM